MVWAEADHVVAESLPWGRLPVVLMRSLMPSLSGLGRSAVKF